MSDRIKNIVITIVFVFIIISVLIINIFSKDIDISKSERRKLAKFPEITLKGIFDGSVIDKFEDYTMDQFVLRDKFRSLKTYTELSVFAKKDVNEIYEKNGSLIKQEYPLNESSVVNLTNKINTIKDKYLDETNNIYYTIVPDKNYYTNNSYLKLDYNKLQNIMSEKLNGIEYINIFDCLKLEDYYYTDTHWKQENLNKVLDKIATQMNFKDRITTPFEEKDITSFKGVYAGQFPVKTKDDYIRVMTNDIIEESIVFNYETNKETKVYDMNKLNANDKYDIYLSGATPLLTITNPNFKGEKELIVFRDSFGSSLIPLFIEAYSKITIIDIRYIATDYLKNFVDFENKDVLFMYSTLVINSSSTLK